MISRTERILAVVDAAKIGMITADIHDQEAVDEAISIGLVERSYEGSLGLVGISKLRLK